MKRKSKKITWEKVEKGTFVAPKKDVPTVTRRKLKGLALNAALMKQVGEGKGFLDLRVSQDKKFVSLEFTKQKTDEDSYTLTKDGSGKSKGRWVECGHFLREVDGLCEDEDENIAYHPDYWEEEDRWVFEIFSDEGDDEDEEEQDGDDED